MLKPVFGPAFLACPTAVAVAVLSPPPIVTVPTMSIFVPNGASDKISPPTVMTPLAVRVWPAIMREVMSDTGGLVTNVEGWAPLITTALPVGDIDIACPFIVITPPGVKV